MVSLQTIDAQLAKVGMKNRFFGRPEVRELCHILAPGEVIQHAVSGQYEGGFGLVLATDRRILLIDKKPWFLTMEDIRYDMVSEVDFYGRLLDSTVIIVTINKNLTFKSWHKDKLRDLVRYIQHRVMQLRQAGHDQWQDEPNWQQNLQPELSAIQPEQDFAANYQRHLRRHSMAHIAGQVAMSAPRQKMIIKPLYPRPSLVAKYRQGGFARQATSTSLE
jgi:hypothetical protein